MPDSKETSYEPQGRLARLSALVPARVLLWPVALLLVLGGLLYVSGGTSTESMEPILGGRIMTDSELDQLELAFGAAGLDSYRRQDGRLLIPRRSRNQYLAVMQSASALPFTLRNGLEDETATAGIFASEAQQRRRAQNEKARALGNKITAFGDIAWASVDYDQQNTSGFDREILQSASVVLTPKDGKPIAPPRIRMIQNFVCAAYAGMTLDQVTVTDTAARKTFVGEDDPVSRRRRLKEYELEQRLAELLSGFEGLRIMVTHGSVGPPSTDLGATDDGEELSETDAESGGEFPDERTRVSLGVPEGQLHSRWIDSYRRSEPESQRVPPPSESDLAAIRETVFQNIRGAVRPFVGNDDAIEIWTYPDSMARQPYALTDSRPDWVIASIDFAKQHSVLTVVLGGLSMIGLVLGLAALRLRVQDPSPASGGAVAQTAGQHPAAAPPTPGDHGAGHATGNATLKDELTELVESNPEVAAQIVHRWISDAA